MTPSTLMQLTILVVFVLPGSVYQAVRARLAGEVPANRDWSNRVLRALAASAVLDSLYGVALGPTLVRYVGGSDTTSDQARRAFLNDVRGASVVGLVTLFIVPSLIAYLIARRYVIGSAIARLRRCSFLSDDSTPHKTRLRSCLNRLLTWLDERCRSRGGLRFDPTPNAWDWAVDHGGSGEGFVRVLDDNGQWHGGLYRPGSFFSTFPESPAIFVEEAWQLDPDGVFVGPQVGSRGAWIPCESVTAVEFLRVVADTPDSVRSPVE